ncbi:metallophosphoesterase 1-like [Aricia agestis]|uniref:metallophosphoesterase 1-like n=1 Tax=Aricia agestis TaxID=91739 RepID=UPI001C201624|nr:metallophosphoesterase 1-like [Aricia agestis]
MRRVTKKAFIFLFGLAFIYFYCEYLIYLVVVAQCAWPTLQNADTLKVLIIADPHLLGPFRGHWLDKWRREWQMKQAFQAIMTLHEPEVVFVLGDLFDEGEWTDHEQFKDYVDRFYNIFYVPEPTKMYVTVGNHDIGFHNRIWRGSAERFEKYLKAPSVQHIILKENHFVLLNSMALEGDNCRLCTTARRAIEKLSDSLRCAEIPSDCENGPKFNYSKPILMQHFPLYRTSDSKCTDEDSPPLPERNKQFRNKIDAISHEATEYIVAKLKPRAVFGGHTHHGCLLPHSHGDTEFLEYSVPSFSWRNRRNPKYMLVSLTPTDYAVNKCGLPKEATVVVTAVVMIITLVVLLLRMSVMGR